MSKSLGFWRHLLRQWQAECSDALELKLEENKKDFLCVAVPAAGKTRWAMRQAHKFLFTHRVARVVVVVPTEHLKKQWANDGSLYGIHLEPNLPNRLGRETSEYHGCVLTYAQVGLNPLIHKYIIDGVPTLVIFDEIHHAGDNKTWGDAIRLAFDNAVFRIELSGTPFRKDNNAMPFITYENNISKADYIYTYGKAIEDKVCRPIYFPAYDGNMEWKVDEKTYHATFLDNLNDVQSSERLRTALDVKSDFLSQMITDADAKLNEIRKEHTYAGGLVFAIDQEHANAIAQKMARLIGEYPTVVISDDPDASSKITKFAKGDSKWLLCVKMVSEGVDIPRLRVGVYATNIRSELFFRQSVGRFIRVIANLSNQMAFLFIPKDPDILKFAKDIEQERDHALHKQAELGEREKEERKRDEENKKDFKPIKSIATTTEQLGTLFGDKISQMFNIDKNSASRIIDVANNREIERQKETPAIFEQKLKLREEINSLSKTYARAHVNGDGTIDWEIAHKTWISTQGGKKIELETLQELIKRRSWLLANV